MNDTGSPDRSRNLGGCLLVMIGLTASVAEILNYLGVKPPSLPRIAQPAQARTPEPPAPPPAPPEPADRPARLVLVVENFGDMPAVAHAVRAIASRLGPGDSLSLISFTGAGGHVWPVRDVPGDRGLAAIQDHPLFAIARRPDRAAAVADALAYLAREPRPGPNPAVVVLSAAVGDEAIELSLRSIRTGIDRPARVFALDGGAIR